MYSALVLGDRIFKVPGEYTVLTVAHPEDDETDLFEGRFFFAAIWDLFFRSVCDSAVVSHLVCRPQLLPFEGVAMHYRPS